MVVAPIWSTVAQNLRRDNGQTWEIAKFEDPQLDKTLICSHFGLGFTQIGLTNLKPSNLLDRNKGGKLRKNMLVKMCNFEDHTTMDYVMNERWPTMGCSRHPAYQATVAVR